MGTLEVFLDKRHKNKASFKRHDDTEIILDVLITDKTVMIRIYTEKYKLKSKVSPEILN